MKGARIAVACLVVFLASAWAVGAFLSPDDLKECGHTPDPSRPDCVAADAVVAVSGGDTLARADEAIELYKNKWAPLLIFSGAAADTSGPSNAAVMKQRALAAGVPERAIIIEDTSQNTRQNAAATTNIFQEQHIKSAIVVTSAYHERRAGLEFRKRATTISVRLHPAANDKHWNTWWWLTPGGWILAIPEVAASLILMAGGTVR